MKLSEIKYLQEGEVLYAVIRFPIYNSVCLDAVTVHFEQNYDEDDTVDLILVPVWSTNAYDGRYVVCDTLTEAQRSNRILEKEELSVWNKDLFREAEEAADRFVSLSRKGKKNE